MSNYSTTLEVIINNTCKDRSAKINDRIISACNYIFDFDYKIPNIPYIADDFKKYFEYCFCIKYFNYEIEQETVARFKLALQGLLLTLLPKYNIIFETLKQVDFNKILTTSEDKENGKNSSNSNSKNTNDTNNTNNTKNTTDTTNTTGSKNASSNLPNNMLANGEIGDFSRVNFADNASISRQDTTSKQDTTSNQQSTTSQVTEQKNNTLSVDEKSRLSRSISQIELIKQYDENFSNYFDKFLNEFRLLFTDMLY